MMKLRILLAFTLSVGIHSGHAQVQDSSSAYQGDLFLDFYKNVYFNPTVLLRSQEFHNATRIKALVLPDMNGNAQNHISSFELGMQKIISYLVEGGNERSIRFYFNPRNTENPFSFVYAEEMWCKFSKADLDSIKNRLNTPFRGVNYTLKSSALFENAIQSGLSYVKSCLLRSNAQCGEQPDYNTTEINTKPLSVSLHNTTGSHYGIDHKRYDQLESWYASANDLHTQQLWYAPAKLMISGTGQHEPVVLAVERHESLFKKENFRIETMYNNAVIPLKPTSTNDSLRIDIPADIPPGNPVEVVVKYTSPVDSIVYTVGFFMVYVHYPQKLTLNVLSSSPVPVPETTLAEIRSELKKIYDPIGVYFTVQSKSWLPDSEWPQQIQIESSGLLSNYPTDLRDWAHGVQDLPDYLEDQYYLVLGLSSGSDITGYMPRARNIGFIFSEAKNTGETAAHELGHGIFHLRHIFSEEELGSVALGLTQNVMDYTEEYKDFYLHQWQFINDPAFVSWFAGDDEDAAATSLNRKVLYYLWELGPDKEILYNRLGYYTMVKNQVKKYVFTKKIEPFDVPWGTNDQTFSQLKTNLALGLQLISNNTCFQLVDRDKMATPPSQTYVLGYTDGTLSIVSKPESKYHSNQVVYIKVKNGKRYFVKTSDKLYLEKFGYKSDAFQHCYVLSYYDSNDELYNQEVWSPETMSDITAKFNKEDSYYYNSTVGENAFYFWEEDAEGNIKDNIIIRPLSVKKTLVPEVVNGARVTDLFFTSLEQAKYRITTAGKNPDGEYAGKQYFEDMDYEPGRDNTQSSVFIHPASLGKTFYRSTVKGKVLYFNMNNHKLTYSHAADSLHLDYFGRSESVKDHHFVFTYWEYDPVKKKSYIAKQRVFRYDGQEITDKYAKYLKTGESHRIALFVNGYRPLMLEFDFDKLWNHNMALEYKNSDDKVYDNEPFNYWNAFGSTFKTDMLEVLKPEYVYYADGHVTATTSNSKSPMAALTVTDAGHFETPKACAAKGHPCKNVSYIVIELNDQYLSKIKVPYSAGNWALITAEYARSPLLIRNYYTVSNVDGEKILSKDQNDAGYAMRFNKGKIAGEALLAQLKSQLAPSEIAGGKKTHDISGDTIDIVAHSMGFAYAMGMIEVLKGKIHLGKFLIIAPENPESAADCAWMVDKRIDKEEGNYEFEEVWHYGSDLDMDDESPPCNQDGVAAQADIEGLKDNRVRVPSEQEMKEMGFNEYLCRGGKDAHFIGNFKWIFAKKQMQLGYIKRR